MNTKMGKYPRSFFHLELEYAGMARKQITKAEAHWKMAQINHFRLRFVIKSIAL